MAEGAYLLFFSLPTGYQLVEREGEPPMPGTEVEVDENNGRFFVSKIAPSPLPHDDRLCAYLQER